MLKRLCISNFILVDTCDLSMNKGLNVFTGETGAGKSMVAEALRWLFGGRASPRRADGRVSSVEGHFEWPERSRLWQALNALCTREGVACPDSDTRFVLRRELTAQGKVHAFVNGSAVPPSVLAEIGGMILDVTSQDSHQALVKAAEQRTFVDALSPDIAREKVRYVDAWRTYHALVKERDACKARCDALGRDEDYVIYQLKQLEGLSLDPGEEERLVERKHALKSLSAWQALGAEAEALFEASRSPFLSALGRLKERLRALADESGVLREEAACFAQGTVALEEGYRGLSRYLRTLDFGERDLDGIEKKLSTLKHLQRKYGMGLEALAAQKEKWQADMAWLSGADVTLKELDAKIRIAREALVAAGEVLSDLRAFHARSLERGARACLQTLGMPKVEFDIAIKRIPASECEAWSQEGADEVTFLFSANPGQPAKPLGKIASGGELSRVLLAVKASASGETTVGSSGGLYLFDEIDAGVGGKTADLVGQVIRTVSAHCQVLCITHLAQVAQYADAHFAIEKEESGKGTRSVIRRLSEKERADEIARMLGGDALSTKTRDLARDILKRGKATAAVSYPTIEPPS